MVLAVLSEPRGSRGSTGLGGGELHGSQDLGGAGIEGPRAAGLGWRRGCHDPQPLQQEEAVTLG